MFNPFLSCISGMNYTSRRRMKKINRDIINHVAVVRRIYYRKKNKCNGNFFSIMYTIQVNLKFQVFMQTGFFRIAFLQPALQITTAFTGIGFIKTLNTYFFRNNLLFYFELYIDQCIHAYLQREYTNQKHGYVYRYAFLQKHALFVFISEHVYNIICNSNRYRPLCAGFRP